MNVGAALDDPRRACSQMTSDWPPHPPPFGFQYGPPPPPRPALELDPATVRPWPGLLPVDPGIEWAVSSLRRMLWPMCVSGWGGLLDEEPFALLRTVVPERALDPGENPRSSPTAWPRTSGRHGGDLRA